MNQSQFIHFYLLLRIRLWSRHINCIRELSLVEKFFCYMCLWNKSILYICYSLSWFLAMECFLRSFVPLIVYLAPLTLAMHSRHLLYVIGFFLHFFYLTSNLLNKSIFHTLTCCLVLPPFACLYESSPFDASLVISHLWFELEISCMLVILDLMLGLFSHF